MAGSRHIDAPAKVYLVQTLSYMVTVSALKYSRGWTYSEIRAALPKTVSNTARYKVVPHTHKPEFFPSVASKSLLKTKTEKAKRSCLYSVR